MPTHSLRRATVIGLVLVTVAAMSSQAQTLRLGVEGVAESENLGRAFQTFSVFGGVPGIAAARYYSDFNINSFQLPIARTFSPPESGPFAGLAPYAEVTVDYLTADRTFALEGGPTTPRSLKLSFNSWSGLAGAGLDVPLGGGFKLRPIFLAGYAHVGGNASFSGPNSAFFQSTLKGILNDAAANTALIGGALALVYERRFSGDLTLAANARYNELAAIVTGATDNSINQNGSFGVANAGVTLSGPTEWRIGTGAIRWLGYVNGTWLPDTDRGVLGFKAFAELGGGLQLIAPSVVPGIQGGTMRASAIVGPGVNGWLVSAAVNF
jgi:hypothetical protein